MAYDKQGYTGPTDTSDVPPTGMYSKSSKPKNPVKQNNIQRGKVHQINLEGQSVQLPSVEYVRDLEHKNEELKKQIDEMNNKIDILNNNVQKLQNVLNQSRKR